MSERIRLMTHNVWRCDVNKPAWEEKGEDCSAAVRATQYRRRLGGRGREGDEDGGVIGDTRYKIQDRQ